MNTREKLIAVFQDTQKFYAENKILIDAVKYGKEYTALYETDDYTLLYRSRPESEMEKFRLLKPEVLRRPYPHIRVFRKRRLPYLILPVQHTPAAA